MSLYLGENLISGVAYPTEPSRNIGQIIESLVPLTDAGLHLLDGTLIRGGGIYDDFVTYMAGLYNDGNYDSIFAQSSTVYNYGTVGSLTETEGILSGFSASNYATIPMAGTSSTNVIFTTRVKLNDFHGTYNDILKPGTTNCPVGFNSAGKLGMYSTSSWILGSTTYTTGTWIWVRVIWDGSSYKVYGLVDNSYTLSTLPAISSWTLEATWTTTTNIWSQQLYLGNSNTTTSEYFNGNIDLNNTEITVESSSYWSGAILRTPEQTWQSSVMKYGACGKFVYDSINNTVRLPKLTGIIAGTTDLTALGDLMEAVVKLPNITGTWGGAPSAYVSQYGTGAITWNSVGGWYGYNTGGGGGAGFSFDASLCSDVYSGNGTDTQATPQTIKVLYYIVIATSTKTDIQVDIDEIATDLNGKADIDLTNVSPSSTFKHTVMNWSMLDYSNIITIASGTSSYTAPSDGLISFNLDAQNQCSVNGHTVYIAGNDSGNEGPVQLLLSSGDVISIPLTNNTLCFIPLKGAS